METAYTIKEKQKLRKGFCKGDIPFSEYVRKLNYLCSLSRQSQKWRIKDTKRANELCVEVLGDKVKVGWHILPNPLDKEDRIQWLVEQGIIEENTSYNGLDN